MLPLVTSILAGCGAEPHEEAAGSESESSLVSDAKSIRAREDGSFDVECKDGRTEIATEIGTFQWMMRSRACNTVTGCAPWSDAKVHSQRDYFFVTRNGSIESYFAAADGSYPSQCGPVTADRTCGAYPAKLTNHCFRATSSSKTQVAADQSYTETAYAALLDF